MRMLSQKKLDEIFPTVVRYLGVVLTIVLIVASLFGNNSYAAGFVAAAGMILYKTVAQAARDNETPPGGSE